MSETDKIRPVDTAERLGDLAERYMDGTLDEMGETELRDMLLSLPEYGIPGKYEALAVLFRGFDAMSQERIRSIQELLEQGLLRFSTTLTQGGPVLLRRRLQGRALM